MRKLLKLKPSKRVAFIAGLALAVVSTVFAVVPAAYAAYGKPAYDAGGYTAWRSYFKDFAPVGVAGWDVLPRQAAYGDNSMPAITDPGSLVNFLRDNYNEAINSDTQNTTGDFNFGWRKTGAAFIGWTMLGVAPGNMGPPGTVGSRETAPDWNELLNRLNALNAAGKISWNVPVSTANYGGVNTRYLGAPYDDVQAVSLPSSVGNGIIFRDYSNNDVYVLRYNCANPLGDLPGLPKAQNTQWTAVASATGPPSVYPGQTINFSYNLHNNGPGSAPIVQYGTRYELYNGGSGLGWSNTPGPGDASEVLPPGGDITTHRTWSYTVPANYTGNKVCTWLSYAPESSSIGGWKESTHFCTNVTQPVPNCAAFNITPSTIEPGVPFTALASVTYQSQQAAFWTYQSGGRLFVTITGPSYNQTQTYPGSPPAAADISYSGFAFPAPTSAGVYNITYGVQGGAIGSKNCSSTMKVAFSPYFRAQGGNVLAGAGFGTGCTTTPAKITSWNQYTGGATPYYGAGTDLAAIALGQITGFVSGNGQNGASTTNLAQAPNNLTFGNSGAGVPNNIPATIYGGAYGVTNWCMPDYATAAASDPSAQAVGGSINSIGIGSLTAGDYIFTLTGNQNLGGVTTVVPAGVRVTIVITGDLTLGGDIIYEPYASLNDIPRLQIFVKGGNINIRKGVSVLTGVYGAQKSGGVGGQIDTCAEPTWTFNDCNGALTFYGTVFADQVLLKRMAGTSKDPTTAAETFVYGPETWLGRNFAVPDTAWQSATSLSPVL